MTTETKKNHPLFKLSRLLFKPSFAEGNVNLEREMISLVRGLGVAFAELFVFGGIETIFPQTTGLFFPFFAGSMIYYGGDVLISGIYLMGGAIPDSKSKKS